MTRTLLLDMDSTIPNLALMHISTWKKAQGNTVAIRYMDDPDEIYASIIFKWNKHAADGLRAFYPNARIDVGGGAVMTCTRDCRRRSTR